VTTTSTSTRPVSGFSLVEVMLAASLGTILLLATMQTTGVFVESVTVLEEADVDDLDRALERIARDVRYAWWVQSPSASELVVANSQGGTLRYELDGTTLKVTHPSGDVGVLAEGVEDLVFTTETMPRYREGENQTLNGVIYEVSGTGMATSMYLGDATSMKIAFTLSESVGARDIEGVDEKLLWAVPETLGLYVGYAYHLLYPTPFGSLTAKLGEAAGPGDARDKRGGVSTSSKTFASSSLPKAWVDDLKLPIFLDRDIWSSAVCHEGVTTVIPLEDLLDHMSHGDIAGTCGVRSTDLFVTPTAKTTLDFSYSAVKLKPGVAYTLTLAPSGTGTISVLRSQGKTASWDTVRTARSGGTTEQWGQSFPFTLRGQRVVTSTTKTDVISGVTAKLVPQGGGAGRSITASVFTQVLALDPWAGVVPGETAPSP
jgi:hypothetical protein